MAEPHDVQVATYGEPGEQTYRAECSCGYDGPGFDKPEDAEEDADEHLTQIARAER